MIGCEREARDERRQRARPAYWLEQITSGVIHLYGTPVRASGKLPISQLSCGICGGTSPFGRRFKARFDRRRRRRGTAAPRSPLLIASTLINETISTGRAAERFSSVPGAACRAAALSFRPILFLPRAAAKPRQFRQSRSSRAGSEK